MRFGAEDGTYSGSLASMIHSDSVPSVISTAATESGPGVERWHFQLLAANTMQSCRSHNQPLSAISNTRCVAGSAQMRVRAAELVAEQSARDAVTTAGQTNG